MRPFVFQSVFSIAFAALVSSSLAADSSLEQLLAEIDGQQTIVAIIGLPADNPQFVNQLAEEKERMIYFQSPLREEVHRVRELADQAGLLGKRVFADVGSLQSIHLSPNLADAVFADGGVADQVSEQEVLRVMRPQGVALIGHKRLEKPLPAGIDDWSHPYHGPDNNPNSDDQLVRGQLETQFIADPKFSPMPEQSVIAGGRIFKAMGHIAHKANQNEMLNTLLCINAYNGSILWRRPLSDGFMIHRNTMIGSPEALYMGDHEACMVIDAKTGEIQRTLTVPADLTDGPVWKWMGMDGDVLYGMVGNLEVKVETVRSGRPGLGHWPWGMWEGHDYKDPRTAFGFGRTIVAFNRHSGELLWNYRDNDFLDARAICMKDHRIYFYCPEKFLACLDATNGQLLWKNTDSDLLEAIGPNDKAQHFMSGYATTCYMKCNEDSIFFAGPQRAKMVVASATDGKLQWTKDIGNLQLVLRDESIYAAGPQNTHGMQLDYKSGVELSSFIARRACTRATGCADSIFFRATGGTVRLMTEENRAEHIAPMRPPCQDGVLVSNGHLYWGPWMCGCQLSLYGNIGLRPVEESSAVQRALSNSADDSLVVHPAADRVQSIGADNNDWLSFRGNNRRSDSTLVQLPSAVQLSWSRPVAGVDLPTAPVAAGGLVFAADRTGAVRAWDATGREVWKAYVGGPVYYPPAIAMDRLFVGSADGKVYAFEAATGRTLWEYRVAPRERWIRMYDKLVSRWPVAGGVVVENNMVYAAAGITHYDGTYVVALDALSGTLRGINDQSGRLSEGVNSGVSMQGELSVVDNELRFPGGGIYEVARYSLDTLECLNEPLHQLTSQYRTAFYPWYPSYDKFVSIEHRLDDGKVLCHDANYDGSAFASLKLETGATDPASRLKKDLAGEFLRRRGKEVPVSSVWTDTENRRFSGFVVCRDVLLATGHAETVPDEHFLYAIRIDDGKDLWKHPLPTGAVKGGIAVDAQARLFVALDNGLLQCFTAASAVE